MQEGLEENKPTRESRKAYRESKRAKSEASRIQNKKDKQAAKLSEALAKDDKAMGITVPKNEIKTVEAPESKAKTEGKGFQAITAVMNSALKNQSSNTTPKSGEAILGAVTSDPNATFSDLQEAPDLVKTANKEEQKIKAQSDKIALNVVNSANKIAEEESVYSQQKKLAGDGSTLAGAVSGSESNRPTAEQYYTKADFEREVAKQLAIDNQDAPDLAIEKLGLEEYYPNIGKDIAVGTYSGKYIGSATIFSAPGARLPMGLYDARKKAIAEAAKAKQVAIDKLYEVPDAAKQLNDSFQSYYIDWISNSLDEAGGYDAFVANPENRKEMLRLQNLAKETLEINTRVQELKLAAQGKDGKQGVYLSKGTRAKIIEWQNGAVEGFDDILKGKKKISELNQYFKSYANGVVWADENMKNWNDTITELPMNLKSNKPLTESQIGEISNAVKMIKDGSGDYDSYMDVIKKYVSIDYDAMVNSWADYSGYEADDDARADLKEYISSQIKDDSFIANVERQVNKNYERWAKRYDRANELEDKKTLYTQFYENAINGGIDKKLASAREQIKAKPGATAEEKTGIMASTLSGLGWDVAKEYKTINKKVYGYVYHRDVLTGGERKPYSLGKEAAKIELYNKKTGQREFVSVDYANNYPNMFKISPDEKEVLSGYATNQDIKVVNSERRSYPSYTGNDGNIYKASTESLGSYTSASKKSVYTETIGAPVKSVPKRDANGTHLRDPETNELLYENKKMDVKISWGAQLDDENQRNAIDTQASKDRQWEAGYRP